MSLISTGVTGHEKALVGVPRMIQTCVDHPQWASWVEAGRKADSHRYRVPLELHHYTSADGLIGIVGTRAIRATDARCLNDRREWTYGMRQCQEALSAIDDPRLALYVQMLRYGLYGKFGYTPYVASFSESAGIVTQWNRYAKDGRGYVVGLDSLCLSNLRGGTDAPIRLMPVEYEPQVQVRRAREAVMRAVRQVREGPSFDADCRCRFVLLGVELFYLCATFKDASWKEEREWRLVYVQRDDDPNALQFATKPDGAPYVALDLTRQWGDRVQPIFTELREGPHTAPDTASHVRRFLLDIGGEMRVVKQR